MTEESKKSIDIKKFSSLEEELLPAYKIILEEQLGYKGIIGGSPESVHDPFGRRERTLYFLSHASFLIRSLIDYGKSEFSCYNGPTSLAACLDELEIQQSRREDQNVINAEESVEKNINRLITEVYPERRTIFLKETQRAIASILSEHLPNSLSSKEVKKNVRGPSLGQILGQKIEQEINSIHKEMADLRDYGRRVNTSNQHEEMLKAYGDLIKTFTEIHTSNVERERLRTYSSNEQILELKRKIVTMVPKLILHLGLAETEKVTPKVFQDDFVNPLYLKSMLEVGAWLYLKHPARDNYFLPAGEVKIKIPAFLAEEAGINPKETQDITWKIEERESDPSDYDIH